ncbi:hypothetical protein COS51_00725 [Candidatus Roizmanbacteria bacterium CG03_land_8_20_14_0_80_36_21]|uniref:Queuine tRNA-ribosyltransferase n=2 Tax=Candidatus Roizmaniibacteriota TaxID=1752723 RepID=A0A2M8KM75_9BACT|nr:MAG: hypothetical protein COS51_00725 [Candidatus Roizmanbacteria bacterium CG03_land_8_20_14_0_80_36_21]PJA53434.1 MAG: hypothetical protein CO166_01885 [Candidatus Roizmanbacteria bacterium CG_4_9_14_3_um_filter_36_11]PJC82043.1 MAG: hypothetical protein CO007_01715 [Candidatus Roizmanbacteria bacterium CG_4_8_14_3_um_filter_36_10]PJE61022.1 MAG: hypothetical protein COU86_01230 [Candidatus Roizmanbacteria bacterium CG10_big_fil_rev_8_21_14_0_10_36_26]
MKEFFKVKHFSKKSKARVGEIKTSHGVIKTPAFVPVATKGTLKALPPQFIKEIGIQVAFVNTYHLVTHPGGGVIEAAGGIHKFANLDIPLMSDSGGFQIFSLAREKIQNSKFKVQNNNLKLKIRLFQADVRGEEEPLVVKISDDGVKFRSTYDGRLIEFTPEKSIEYQSKIGADLMMSFDECTYYPATHEYTKRAMERTHGWLIRCINYKRKTRYRNFLSPVGPPPSAASQVAKNLVSSFSSSRRSPITDRQYLYGVVQGGTFKDLRKKSAEFVVFQNTDGVAIGGVSVGESKRKMRDQVRWVADYLPKDRPVHLLGVGQFDDIVDLVKYGIDTFDCVEPTRLARVGRIYEWRRVVRVEGLPTTRRSGDIHRLSSIGGRETRDRTRRQDFDIDILKGIYKKDLSPVDENCQCYVCQNFTKAYLHHLFKQKEILGYTLATYHNLWVMERFFEKIRDAIRKDLI